MCGIAGVVDFARGAGDRRLIEAMTATMALRGPDASGIWSSPTVALGHRRLAVIDIEGGAQPMTARANEGHVIAALTFSGEIYNFVELRDELIACGHRFATSSDTEVVLQAYLQWGTDSIARLNGMFAFALWDEARQQLVLARDRMGIKPLYVSERGSRLLFGSEPKAILADPESRPEVDTDGLRQLLTRIKVPGATPWRGMREVRPGTFLTFTREGCSEQTYWRLEAKEHTDDLATTIATVRELLDDIVARQLVADVPLCTLLSGGLDSSAITALAAHQLDAAGGGPVRTFAVDFTGQAEAFASGPQRGRRTHDTPFVHDVADLIGSRHTDIVLDSAALTDPAAREAVLAARDLPLGGTDFDTSLYLLFRAIREHSTVALSGESADEVFGGYAWFHHPRVIESTTFPWAPGSGRRRLPLLRRDVVAELELAAFVDDAYLDATREVPHVSGASVVERKMREACYLALTRFVPTLLDRKDRMSMANGLEVRVPFCDDRLVSYVFNTPWSFKTFDGREKSLLRAATADVLPASVVGRKKSPYPVTRDPAYARDLRRELTNVAATITNDHPAAALVDVDAVRRVAAGGGRRGRALRSSIERALTLYRWFDTYQPALV